MRNVAGDVTVESTLFVTSLPATAASAEALLGLVRGHRGTENKLHFVRDVVFGEDACRVRAGDAPQVFAAVRNAALNLLRGAGHDRIASATRYFAAKAGEALALLGLTPEPNEKTLGPARTRQTCHGRTASTTRRRDGRPRAGAGRSVPSAPRGRCAHRAPHKPCGRARVYN